MTNTLSTFKNDETGLTLIDVSIMLLIIGILTTPMMQAYNLWQQRAKINNTEASLATTAEAVNNFYFLNDYYPCPADPTLGPDNPNYGMPDTDSDPVAPNCLRPVVDGIVFGAIPFKSLKMTPDETLDGYQHKLVYAVTATQTKASTFTPTGGTIQVNQVPLNADGECSNNPPALKDASYAKVQILFYSLGEDGIGAYNENGKLIQACNTSASADQVQNCDQSNRVFVDNFCRATNTTGSRYFDDILYGAYLAYIEAPTKIWDNSTDPQDIGTKNLFVGIGTPPART
jgi:type II secretory pathway pseudopilin PulG